MLSTQTTARGTTTLNNETAASRNMGKLITLCTNCLKETSTVQASNTNTPPSNSQESRLIPDFLIHLAYRGVAGNIPRRFQQSKHFGFNMLPPRIQSQPVGSMSQ